ncbi:MAG: 50S ribosomal protein L5 [Parcubacteria group bacterium GW2011_GWA1_40_21]|nr:MAG: 50S ribosomal protein L5 [Parcubacteria group bacterium GW2011_GWA1_40_21]
MTEKTEGCRKRRYYNNKIMTKVKEKQNKTFESLSKKFGYVNKMQAPKVEKVVVSIGIGSLKDKKKIDLISDRLQKITGQKPAIRESKKSIAAFRVREGDPVGFQVTLRGKRMFDFLDKLFNVALPRARDFRGLSRKSVDDMGNYSIGLKEHVIFPETSDEDIKDVFGMAITIVTTASGKDEATAFLEYIGLPLKKE